MRYIDAGGRRMSAFTLGTVQLGMDYGLGADRAKPSEEKAFAVLDRAMESGVDNLDTANNYGDSEKVIGRWLQRRREQGLALPQITTKIGPFDHASPEALRADMLRQTERSLKTLGIDAFDCLMLHNYGDFSSNPDETCRFLQRMKAEGIARRIAVSVYADDDYRLVARSGFDAVQIPQNVFDWRQIESGGIEALKSAGMLIFVRSVFLQGLVFHTPETLPDRLAFAAPYLQRYLDLCAAFGLSPAVLALSFVLSLPGVTTAVMGCDNPEQVSQNAALFDRTVTLTPSQMDALREAFADIDPRVPDPRVWSKGQ